MSGTFGATETSTDAVNSSETPNNSVTDESRGIKDVVKTDLLDSKTETLTKQIEPSSDHDSVGAVHPSIDETRVSGDELGLVMENSEKVLDEIAVNDEEKECDKVVVRSENVINENVVNDEEKEGEYKVTDLVWGKVKSYPWWPGQIFDSSASTDKAKKYSNKKGFLIAYFGDQSFAWNKVPNIKPFRKSFSKMEKQSNSEKFCNAVNCALDEVSRRIEFGLACSCLSKDVYDKLKTQVFVNAGIKNEASRIDGGDKLSTVVSFKPVDVVKTVQDLAREHFDGYNTLEVMSVRSRLLAYYRWKGYHQFKSQDIVDGLDNEVEDNSKIPLVDEDVKPASESEKVSNKKRKLTVSDSVPSKKERRLIDNNEEDKVVKYTKSGIVGEKVTSKKKKLNVRDSVPSKKDKTPKNVTPKGSSSVVNGKSKVKKSDVIKEDSDNETKDKKSTDSSPKSFFRIGDRISRIAKQLSESPSPALLKESKKSKDVVEKTVLTDRKKKRKNRESVEE